MATTPPDDPKDAPRPAVGRESASQGEPATPADAQLVPEGGEAPRLTWAERGTRRLNRLRSVVAKSLLSTGDSDVPTAAAAIGFLRRVVFVTEPATTETRTQAAGTLARAAVAMSKEPKGAPSIDARSVTVNIGTGEGAALPSVPEAVRAALAAFRTDATRDGAP